MNPALVDETANIPERRKDRLGRNGLGRPMVYVARIRLCPRVRSAAFAAEAKKALVELCGNDPNPTPDYSRIINARAVDRRALTDRTPAKGSPGASPIATRTILRSHAPLPPPSTWTTRSWRTRSLGRYSRSLPTRHSMKPFAGSRRRHDHWLASSSAATRTPSIGSLASCPTAAAGVNLVNVHLFVETMPFGGTGSAGINHYLRQIRVRCAHPRKVDADLPHPMSPIEHLLLAVYG